MLSPIGDRIQDQSPIRDKQEQQEFTSKQQDLIDIVGAGTACVSLTKLAIALGRDKDKFFETFKVFCNDHDRRFIRHQCIKVGSKGKLDYLLKPDLFLDFMLSRRGKKAAALRRYIVRCMLKYKQAIEQAGLGTQTSVPEPILSGSDKQQDKWYKAITELEVYERELCSKLMQRY